MLKTLKTSTLRRFFVFVLCFSFLGMSKISTAKTFAVTAPDVKILEVASAVNNSTIYNDWSIYNVQKASSGNTYNVDTNSIEIQCASYGGGRYPFNEGYVEVDGETIGHIDDMSNSIYLYSYNNTGSDTRGTVTTGFILKNLTSGTHRIQVTNSIVGTTKMYSDAIYVTVP